MAVNFVPQVEPEVMPTVRDRIAAWEKVSTDLRAACVKVAFGEDPEAHVRRLASIRQPIGVAIRGTLGGGQCPRFLRRDRRFDGAGAGMFVGTAVERAGRLSRFAYLR